MTGFLLLLAFRPFVATGAMRTPHGRAVDRGGIGWNPLLSGVAAISLGLCAVTGIRQRRLGWDQGLLLAAVSYWMLFLPLPQDPCNYDSHPALRRLAICG